MARYIVTAADRRECVCQKCRRPLRYDADCSAENTSYKASHNDIRDMRGNPTCGACLNVYKGDWSVWRETPLFVSDMVKIHDAMMDDWDPSRRVWEEVIEATRRTARDDPPAWMHAEGEENTLRNFLQRRTYAVKLLGQLIQYFYYGYKPDGAFKHYFRDRKPKPLTRDKRVRRADQRRAA